MKLKGGQQYQFNQLKEDIHKEISRNTFPTTIFNTVNNISRVINAIRLTRGKNWAAAVLDDNGKPAFTATEQQRYTELFKPHIPEILAFFNDKEELPAYLAQKGGQYMFQQGVDTAFTKTLPDVLPKVELPQVEIPTIPTLEVPTISTRSPIVTGSDTSIQPTKKKGKLSSLSSAATGAVADSLSQFDLSTITPDVLFDNVMSTLKRVNESINEKADAINLTNDFDEHPDIPLGTTGIMISPRLIVFLIYYVLDITRIAVGMAGNDMGRKLLSILVSILDLARGDWKKALLTFMGYFGNSPMLIGGALKTYLTVIQMLSPTLQIKLPYFMYDSAKSIIFGIMLSVIQIGAPKPIRNQIDSILDRLSSVQREIDTKLNNLNPPLTSRPDYLKADFTNLNNLQSILDDPVYVCSAEHRKAVDDLLASVGKEGAPAVQLLLSLMRYPHTPGMTKYKCDDKAKKSYVTLLIDEGLHREQESASDTAAEEPIVPAVPEVAKAMPIKGGKRVLRIRSKGTY